VASLAFPYASKFIHGLSMPLSIIILGLAAALAVALISAAIPAALAARLQVAQALVER
jgi:ABC-type antimicrobial peptide transport system permease subunit